MLAFNFIEPHVLRPNTLLQLVCKNSIWVQVDRIRSILPEFNRVEVRWLEVYPRYFHYFKNLVNLVHVFVTRYINCSCKLDVIAYIKFALKLKMLPRFGELQSLKPIDIDSGSTYVCKTDLEMLETNVQYGICSHSTPLKHWPHAENDARSDYVKKWPVHETRWLVVLLCFIEMIAVVLTPVFSVCAYHVGCFSHWLFSDMDIPI